eukprot:403361554
MAPPDDLEKFHSEVVQITINHILSGNGNALIHCRGGVGRAGLLGCCILANICDFTNFKKIIEFMRKRRDKRCVESRNNESDDALNRGTHLNLLDSLIPEAKKYTDLMRLYRQRIPFLLEDYFGFDRRYEIAHHIPGNLITFPERKLIKDGEIDEVKKMYFKGLLMIDDPIDSYSKHTMLHDAVVMNRTELFDFLLSQKANLMVRDVNGYTPMLKAAALGRLDMVQQLIEEGVDPRHIDPYGNTPRDKAKLYNRYELMEYLEEMEKKASRGELNIVNWKDPERLRRTGKFITIFDY